MEKVLIIDDDTNGAALLEKMLRAHGYQTLFASNEREGMKLITDFTPEIILLRLMMPGLDALKLCQTIRNTSLPTHPSIILITGTADKNSLVEAVDKGADDFITKPVNEMELIARIETRTRTREFYRKIHEDKKNLEDILDITKTISSTLNTDEVLYSIVKKLAAITNATRCSIVLIAQKNVGYVLVSHESPSTKNIKLDLNKYPEIKEALANKQLVVVNDIPNNPLMSEVKDLVKNLEQMNVIVVPIVFEEKVVGTLFLRTHRPIRSFTEKEIDLCKIVANSAWHAIKNAKLYEDVMREKQHMRMLAITDSLTGLYNHNYFYSRLEDEFNLAARYQTHLSVIMIDLDNFKRVNDTHGHVAGDAVLKKVADIIRKKVRKTDIVARYGGEEFAIILPHTNIKGAEEEASRIKEALLSHRYQGLGDEIVTASLGIASYPSGDTIQNTGDLVNLADTALYEAKRSGKNRVFVLGQK